MYDEKNLKILLIIGLCIFNVIIYFLIFAFDIEVDDRQEKVGFVITGKIHAKGWNESNYSGIKKACEDLNLELLVRENIPEKSGQCAPVVEELISEGANIIVLMSSITLPKFARLWINIRTCHLSARQALNEPKI